MRADGFSNSAATPCPASTGADRDGSAFHAIAAVEDRRELAPGSRSSTSRNDAAHARASAAGTLARIATASSISSSVTSSDGANRSAVGVTALTTSPASRHAARPASASMPGRELGRDQQARAAHVGDAGDLRAAPSASALAGARRARGHVARAP